MMNERLSQLIAYKAGGRQADFAALMGWTPQYVQKLLRGDNFGLKPVLRILTAMPEVDARWLLFGEGDMLTTDGLADIRQAVVSRAQTLLAYEKYMPVMNADELGAMEKAVKDGAPLEYSADTLASLEERLVARQNDLDARFRAANAKSTKPCKPRTAKKS